VHAKGLLQVAHQAYIRFSTCACTRRDFCVLTLTHTQLAASEVHAQAVQEELTSASVELADLQALYATAKLDLEGECQYLYFCTSKVRKLSTCDLEAFSKDLLGSARQLCVCVCVCVVCVCVCNIYIHTHS
jgi:hypothetical protein